MQIMLNRNTSKLTKELFKNNWPNSKVFYNTLGKETQLFHNLFLKNTNNMQFVGLQDFTATEEQKSSNTFLVDNT